MTPLRQSFTKHTDMTPTPQPTQLATLGGGCFWCLDAVYRDLNGVIDVQPGYPGGTAVQANSRDVCSGTTRHAEVVQVEFDPSLITFADLLEIFWHVHDPTTPNRQGNDVGPQYRSIIFYHHAEQEAAARHSMETVGKNLWKDPIVTELEPFQKFYPAETYHQDYYNKVGSRNPYCTFVISPKVAKIRKAFAERLK